MFGASRLSSINSLPPASKPSYIDDVAKGRRIRLEGQDTEDRRFFQVKKPHELWLYRRELDRFYSAPYISDAAYVQSAG